ncbi:MAG TPA: Gfo/Idh/MocA family oxidoreductase [Phycisphaerae bacterium]|nr:Gfo/Idh/MocA family oxidoreductase [Phycisphaerae bacterium]
MPAKVRWGILGTGAIASKMAQALHQVEGAEPAAVGSRSQASADAFGDKFGVPRRHASYEALAADPDVDVVYIATPHPMHMDNSMLCLGAGKAVLCEKPFTVNAGQAREVIELARSKGLFLMEAMWSRFVPSVVKLRQLLAGGAIGEVRMVQADFGFRARLDPTGRLFDPALAGGGLLDVGVYCISLASMILGPPVRVTGLAHIGETGVDEQAGAVLLGQGGKIAVLSCGVRTNTPHEAVVMGTDGMIRLHSRWWSGAKLTLCPAGEPAEEIDPPIAENGFVYEVQEVHRCLTAGRTESDVMPLDETVGVLATMDALRAQWGLRYPME